MKYFLYISDLKIEQLFSQLPIFKKILLQFSLKLKTPIADIDVSEAEKSNSKYSKLKIIEKYLIHKKEIGTIEAPKSFIKGESTFIWGPYEPYGHELTDKFLVYFYSNASKKRIQLIGSQAFVIGETGKVPASIAYLNPKFINNLIEETHNNLLISLKQHDVGGSVGHSEYSFKEKGEYYQKLEFLAKVLYSDETTIVASPVYVSLL